MVGHFILLLNLQFSFLHAVESGLTSKWEFHRCLVYVCYAEVDVVFYAHHTAQLVWPIAFEINCTIAIEMTDYDLPDGYLILVNVNSAIT